MSLILATARIGLGIQLAYRTSAIVSSVAMFVQIAAIYFLWAAVYGSSTSINGFSLRALLAYLVLANVQSHIMSVSAAGMVHSRIRTGVVIFDLMRPTHYLLQNACLQIGRTWGAVLLIFPCVPFILIAGALPMPASALAGTSYFVALIIGYMVGLLIALAIGLAGFWLLEASGIVLLHRLVSQFFAGTLVPLSFFSGELRSVAEFLPFKYMSYVPAGIYVGVISGDQTTASLLGGMSWIVVLLASVCLLWKFAQRRVVIQGG